LVATFVLECDEDDVRSTCKERLGSLGSHLGTPFRLSQHTTQAGRILGRKQTETDSQEPVLEQQHRSGQRLADSRRIGLIWRQKNQIGSFATRRREGKKVREVVGGARLTGTLGKFL
jgi:hypothetical protein